VLNRNEAQLLFETLERLLELRPDVKLMMIGNHKTVLPDMPQIIETGYLTHEQLVRSLGACDVMLLPLKDTVSSRGRWPSKINDYLAAGKPTVASAVGDICQLFHRHAIGQIAGDDAESLAQAANNLLSQSELRRTMGQNARRLAENELNWSVLGNRLNAHYLDVLAQQN
jgi:glycosyltransferase involved in cell wall biosynthesis